jgi:hypothetical protein
VSHEAGREGPELLSARLKRLRDAEFAQPMDDFDVEAAVRGGRRRRRRRAVAEVGGAVAGVVLIVALVGGVLLGQGPDRAAVTAGPASPASASSAAPRPRPTGPSLYSYTKTADTVTVYDGYSADRKVVAKVSASGFPAGKASPGRALLRIRATAEFSFSTKDFVWVGGGREWRVSKPAEVTVAAGETRTVELRFRGTSGTALIWEPLITRGGLQIPGKYTWYR